MPFEMQRASLEQKSILQNLARFYIHDLSEYQKTPCPEDGLFEDEDYIDFWSTPDNHPFLIRCNDEWAGFVLLEKGGSVPEVDWNMAEFFILRKFRSTGLAQDVAQQIFTKFPGRWELMIISNNLPAQKFWKKIIHAIQSENVEHFPKKNGRLMDVFYFSTCPR